MGSIEETGEDLGHTMIVPAVILHLIIATPCLAGKIRSSSSPPGQCRTNSDCNKWSPYCSDFGYCQWTDKFGDHPHEDDDTNLVEKTTYAETEYPDVFDVVTSASAYDEDSDADYDYETYPDYNQYYDIDDDFDNLINKSDSTTPTVTNNPVSSTTEFLIDVTERTAQTDIYETYSDYYQYYDDDDDALDFDNLINKSDSTTPTATNNPASSTTQFLNDVTERTAQTDTYETYPDYYQYYYNDDDNELDFNKSDSTTPTATNNPVSSVTEFLVDFTESTAPTERYVAPIDEDEMIESKGTLTQNDFTTPMDSPFQTIETFMKPEVKSENIKPIKAQLLEQFNISLHLLPPPVKPVQNVVTNAESSVDRNDIILSIDNHINLQETLHTSVENEVPSDVSELFSELTTTTNSPTLKPTKLTKEESKSFNSSNPAHISDVDVVQSSPIVTKEKA